MQSINGPHSTVSDIRPMVEGFRGWAASPFTGVQRPRPSRSFSSRIWVFTGFGR
jgi:hypothetical protein